MPKKGQKKLKPEQILIQQEEVFKLRTEGKSQRTIGEILGLSQSRVFQILVAANKIHSKYFAEDINNIKIDHLMRFEAMKEVLYRAWDNSDKTAEDVKILEEVRKLDADIRKIFGADAPERSINANLDVSKLSDEQLQYIINLKS